MLKTIAKFGAANVYKMYHESSICDWHFVKYTIQSLAQRLDISFFSHLI